MVFVTKFVICITNFVTCVRNFVMAVTNFLINFFLADSEKHLRQSKNFQADRNIFNADTKNAVPGNFQAPRLQY